MESPRITVPPEPMKPQRLATLTSPLLAFALLAAACTDAGEPPEPGPRILIFGSGHLAQQDERTADPEVAAVVDSLRPYRPDMVVVEYLPADWPVGEGRDYRWEFDDPTYAADWGVPLDSAAERLAALESELDGVAYSELSEERRCELARLHFLTRDRANALYYWTDADCAAESDSLLTEWIAHRGEHEMARIAFPLARENGLKDVVSFDYQGDDARWFFGMDLYREIQEEGTEAQLVEADSVMHTIESFGARVDSVEAAAETFIEMSRYRNSPLWIELQRQVYEDVFPVLTYDDSAGARQTAHYWLRNERMFDEIEEAVAARSPERILVVVGAGHKYFLDELSERRGYRWVDPLEYLNE